jgi:S1-C subfamily serine protease
MGFIMYTAYKQIYRVVFILFIALPLSANANKQEPPAERAVVKIITHYIDYSYSSPWKTSSEGTRSGSGVIIGNSYILTNAHVVSNATYIIVKKENDPNIYEAQVARIGHECDLAVLKVKETTFFRGTTSLEFGGIPRPRSKVTTYGYPKGGQRISITEGIVSRIEIGFYSHSAKSQLLRIQTDAALNSGNSGGPVVQEGKIVGIAFQVNSNSDNIGYMIPVPVIQHFLIDIQDGVYNGFPELGVFTMNLQNKSHREYLGMLKNQTGILVTDIVENSSAHRHLKKGDIITDVDGIPVANDGSIYTKFGRLKYSFIVDMKQPGEKVKVSIIRKKRNLVITFPVSIFPVRIKWYNEYETKPEYFIFAGIVFQPLSREYMKTWNKWWLNASKRMRYYYFYHMRDRLLPERKEFIVINNILPDSVNTYISDIKDVVVSEINSIPIHSLSDVVRAFKKPVGDYHIIKIDDDFSPILIKADDVSEADKRIIKKYNIPHLRSFSNSRSVK